MNRYELEQFIKDTYVVETNFPWDSAPTFEVFRHPNNQKWFALIMDIKKSSLGLDSDDLISVVNLKCEPALIGSFIKDDGIFPAYHMNKEHWLSVALDGSVPEDRIKLLVDISFELTALKVVKNMRKKS